MPYPPNSLNASLYDALIIGGGPAGTTAAALIASADRRVLLLERSRFPREKLCGEFISPECLEIFERLGAASAIRDAGAVSIEKMDFIAPNGTRIEIPSRWFPGGLDGAVGLTRARLDGILMENARLAGADIVQEMTAIAFERTSEGFVVTARDSDSRTHRFSGRLLIDASGRGQVFGDKESSAKGVTGKTRWFAAKVHLRNVKGIGSGGELYFFDAGYGGITAVEADGDGPRFNLCFLTTEARFRQSKGDRARLLESTLMMNPVARERLTEAVVCGDWLGAGPIVYGSQPKRAGVISIGDAGAFIDPFTGSGILLAMSSAEMLASAIAAHREAINADTVREAYEVLFGARTRRRFGAAAIIRRMALSGALRRVAAPLLASHSGLTRLLAAATRDRADRAVRSDRRMT